MRGDYIRTIDAKFFTYGDSCNLAWLVYCRWGREMEAAATAWRRLMQNSCSNNDFARLVNSSEMNNTRVKM